jgi:hypothetical protein
VLVKGHRHNQRGHPYCSRQENDGDDCPARKRYGPDLRDGDEDYLATQEDDIGAAVSLRGIRDGERVRVDVKEREEHGDDEKGEEGDRGERREDGAARCTRASEDGILKQLPNGIRCAARETTHEREDEGDEEDGCSGVTEGVERGHWPRHAPLRVLPRVAGDEDEESSGEEDVEEGDGVKCKELRIRWDNQRTRTHAGTQLAAQVRAETQNPPRHAPQCRFQST